MKKSVNIGVPSRNKPMKKLEKITALKTSKNEVIERLKEAYYLVLKNPSIDTFEKVAPLVGLSKIMLYIYINRTQSFKILKKQIKKNKKLKTLTL